MVNNKPRHKYVKGFTLIEILLVVLIIAIMTVIGANVINSQSPERNIMNAASQFESELQFMCDLSILENRAHGVEWTETGRRWMSFQAGDWVLKENQMMAQDSTFQQQILLDGVVQILASDAEELPHVICQTDGSFNPFEVRWKLFDDDTVFYAVQSETPWKIKGAWVEQK